MPKNASVTWSESALGDLEEILETQIVSQRLDQQLTSVLLMLEEFPEAGEVIDPGLPNIRRLVVGRFILAYRFFPDRREVLVSAFLDPRRSR